MPRSPRGLDAAESGVSLVEVLTALMLLALLVAGVLPLLTGGEASYQELHRRQEMTHNARVALDRLLRELRAADSYRALAPGLVRFTLNWGEGTGSRPTVEYSLNAATDDLEYRWSADWDYRRQMQLLAVDAVPAGYAVSFTFNHAALVAAGQSLASGDDVRVQYWNGSAMVELDRVPDPASGWNAATTTIWFRLQAPIPTTAFDRNYYLYYGNPAAGPPPANADAVFLDYEDGTTLDGWTRQDTLSGSYAASPTDGFVFSAPSGSGYRQLAKAIANANAEIFWSFRSLSAGTSDRHQTGVSARRAAGGAGYVTTPVERVSGTWRLRIRRVTNWTGSGSVIGNIVVAYTPGATYYGRFYLVDSSLRARIWPAGSVEPAAWMLTVVNSVVASGLQYGLVNGSGAPTDHRQGTVILRPRVPLEPIATFFGVAASGSRPDPLERLAGPFRSLALACFNGAGTAIFCSPPASVRMVEVTLVVLDPTGRIPDITLTGRAARQGP